MSIAQLIGSEYEGAKDLSAIGGVETGRDAAEFILLGANSVQVPLQPHYCHIYLPHEESVLAVWNEVRG